MVFLSKAMIFLKHHDFPVKNPATQKENKIKKIKVAHKILIPEWICGKAEIP